MEYNIDNAELTATLTAVNLDAAVIGQVPLEVAIGESARIDVGEAINYIKTGTAEIAAAVQEGTAAFDLNAEQKTADFNFNASNKTAEYNQNASDKTAAFDNNAETKTQAFDDNATAKTTDFDSNYSDKLSAFNNNASAKTQVYNDNATAKTTAFNENAAIKQAAVDASADAAAASASAASASATTAKQYAIGVPSEPSGYSAKYWAEQTAQSLSGLQSDVAGIKAVIPASATASNKLTDKSYVDTADNNLQSQIDAITASSDVTDIVGTYAELQSYDTSTLPPNSIIKVLQDESRNNETTYYRWVITGGVGAWSLIGEEGPYYTISAADAKFATQTALSTGLSGKQDTLVSGTNIKTVNNQSLLGSGDLTVTASAAWGSITGTLSAQTDLQNALNAKANNADLATVAMSGNYADLSGKPDLSNYVTLNTDQTISGDKTFVDNFIHFKTDITYSETPPANRYGGFNFLDKNGTEISAFYTGLYTGGAGLSGFNLKNKSGNTAGLFLRYSASGTFYTEAPTPTDTTTTSGTQIATTGWVNSANNNVVHKTGNETINGTKTFTDDVYVSKEVPRFCAKNSALTKGTAPSANVYSGFNFYDSSTKAMGRILYGYSTTKTSSVSLDAFKANSSSDTAVAAIAIHYPASGNPYTACPASDVNGSIVTTVNKSKAANGYFQLGNGLIIQWGTRTNSGNVTFPKAFTTHVSVSLSTDRGVPNPGNITKTGFTANSYDPVGTPTFNWIAIGY